MATWTQQQQAKAEQRTKAFQRAEMDALTKQLDGLKQTLRNLEVEVARMMVVRGHVVEEEASLLQVGVYHYRDEREIPRIDDTNGHNR